MMKFIVLLSLVALCYSTPISVEKNITIEKDGIITITGTQGREIDISRSTINPRIITITFKIHYETIKKIQVEETANFKNFDFKFLDTLIKNISKDHITQYDILFNIIRDYEGTVNEHSYKILLEKIQTLVNKGLLRRPIFEALRILDQWQTAEEFKHFVQTVFVMDHFAREYPVEGVKELHTHSDVVPVEERLYGLNQYRNDLPYQRNFDVQGLWNFENMTPYQRYQICYQMLQYFKQQPQYKNGLRQESTPTEFLEEQRMDHGLMHQQQLGHYQFAPINHNLYNLETLRGQQYTYPQQWKQTTQQRIVPYQWAPQTENMKVVYQQVPQMHEQLYQQVYPQYYPQQYYKQVYPQQYYKQVYPQQGYQGYVVPQQTQGLYEQGRMMSQQNLLNHQHGSEKMPVSH